MVYIVRGNSGYFTSTWRLLVELNTEMPVTKTLKVQGSKGGVAATTTGNATSSRIGTRALANAKQLIRESQKNKLIGSILQRLVISSVLTALLTIVIGSTAYNSVVNVPTRGYWAVDDPRSYSSPLVFVLLDLKYMTLFTSTLLAVVFFSFFYSCILCY